MTALAHPARIARPSLSRLTAVELRKMVDTRAGFWLLATIVLLVLATTTIGVLVDNDEVHHFSGLFQFALVPIGLLLPVLGILSITSEWSQRTALATFSLVPDRERVTAAKLLAGCALGTLAVVASLLAAAAGNLIIGESWGFGWSRAGSGLLFVLLSMLGGMAFGLLFLSSSLAIVVYFVLPTAWSILGATIPALDGVAPWLDTSPTMSRLAEDTMRSGDWGKLATSLTLWLLLPLLLGLWRVGRSEVK